MSAADSATRHHRPVGHDRQVGALAGDAHRAERDDVLAFRHLAAGGAVHELRLEHDDGIGIADRRREQPLRVRRRRGDRDLHAGRVHVVGLGRIVVQLGGADAAAVRHPQRDRELHLTPRPPAVAADVVDQLVEAGIRERVVLHLADGAPSGHAQPDRRAEDPRLRQRRVDAAVGTEPVEEPRGRAEDTARPGRRPRPSPAPSRPVPARCAGSRSPPRRASAQPSQPSRSIGGGSAYACANISSGSAGGSASAAAIPSRIVSAATALTCSTVSSSSTPSRRR